MIGPPRGRASDSVGAEHVGALSASVSGTCPGAQTWREQVTRLRRARTVILRPDNTAYAIGIFFLRHPRRAYLGMQAGHTNAKGAPGRTPLLPLVGSSKPGGAGTLSMRRAARRRPRAIQGTRPPSGASVGSCALSRRRTSTLGVGLAPFNLPFADLRCEARRPAMSYACQQIAPIEALAALAGAEFDEYSIPDDVLYAGLKALDRYGPERDNCPSLDELLVRQIFLEMCAVARQHLLPPEGDEAQ
jgi:hypothetical protein